MKENKKELCKDYKGVYGFMDLRNYVMKKEAFNIFWNLQEYLKNEQQKYFRLNKDNQKANISHWNDLKKMSLNYQQCLLKYPLKKKILH